MRLFLKDPAALVDYEIEWGDWLAADETLTASSWAVEPIEPGGLAVAMQTGIGTARRASVSGGVRGHLYRLTNRIATSAGRTDERSLAIRIIER